MSRLGKTQINPGAGRSRRTTLFSVLLVLVVFASIHWRQAFDLPDGESVASSEEARAEEEVRIPEAVVQMMIQSVEEPIEEDSEPAEPAEQETAVEPPPSPQEAIAESSGDEAAPPTSGNSPEIEGRFDVPVLDYVEAVKNQAGGRLIIWDRAAGKAIGEVRNTQFDVSFSLKNFSNRARDLTDDLPRTYRENVLQQVRQHHRFGIWRFVLVVPEQAEERFEAALSGVLGANGLQWEEVDLLQLRYGLKQGQVTANLVSASTDGRRVAVNRTVTLW